MCTLSPNCVIRPSAFRPQLEWDGPAVGKKAASRPTEHRIWVEKKFWKSLGANAVSALDAARQRLALVCHELGHEQGAECEECADTRGGQIYRELGIDSDHAAIEMFLTRIQHRSADGAAAAFHAGFQGYRGARPADAGSCAGTVDGAGLCKAPVLSFHGNDAPGARQMKARARGMDEGQCSCIHAGSGFRLSRRGMGAGFQRSALFGRRCDALDASEPAWKATLVRPDAATRHPEANVVLPADSRLARGLVAAGHVPPFRATYDPTWFSADGQSLPILPPLVLDARGHIVSGPAGMTERVPRIRTHGIDGITPATLVSNLLNNAPTTVAPFKTSYAPTGESLAQILADVAFKYFPDDPYRYAYLMLAIINHEALPNTIGSPQDGSYLAGSINWNYTDGTVGNNDPTPGGKGTEQPTKAVSSTDFGLGQINNKWHSDLTNQTYSDPDLGTVDAWGDARLNVGMLAQVLLASKNDFPGDYLSELNSYGAGTSAVRKGLAASPPVAFVNSKGVGTPFGSDSGTAELGWLATLGINPNDPSQWVGLTPGGSPSATPDGVFGDLASLVPTDDSDTFGTATPGDIASTPGDITEYHYPAPDPSSAAGAAAAVGAEASDNRFIAILIVAGIVLVMVWLYLQDSEPGREPENESPDGSLGPAPMEAA